MAFCASMNLWMSAVVALSGNVTFPTLERFSAKSVRVDFSKSAAPFTVDTRLSTKSILL